ncbi:unnamed protein product [Agarophyton chilense]
MQRRIAHDVGDEEGRVLMVELPCIFVVCAHAMHSMSAAHPRLDMRLSWDRALRKHVRNMRARGKPLLLLGNLASSSRRVERAVDTSFQDLLETCDLVDTCQHGRPDCVQCALASRDMVRAVRRVDVLDRVHGASHCPLLIHLTDGIL